MSFWTTSTGEDAAANAEKEYDIGGGDFPVIPDGSNVLAFIDEAKWDKDRDFNEYISLRWNVEKPEAYEGARVWQKLWVDDLDPNHKNPESKRDKAIKMLATIDSNCGGKLVKKGGKPTNDELALALTNRQMVIKCMVWEMNGKEGNWVAAVSPKDKELSVAEGAPARKKAPPANAKLDDDIPF
jgi:hypothetical protein